LSKVSSGSGGVGFDGGADEEEAADGAGGAGGVGLGDGGDEVEGGGHADDSERLDGETDAILAEHRGLRNAIGKPWAKAGATAGEHWSARGGYGIRKLFKEKIETVLTHCKLERIIHIDSSISPIKIYLCINAEKKLR
jgi:hypothetical protein